MTTHYAHMVGADNHEINQEQALQTFTPVTVETHDDNKDEYRGPHLHFHVPPQATQPIVQNLNQRVQIPPSYPRVFFVVASPFVYLGAPYAPYGGHYGQTAIHIVNS